MPVQTALVLFKLHSLGGSNCDQYINVCGRIIQASSPLHYKFVDGLDVPFFDRGYAILHRISAQALS